VVALAADDQAYTAAVEEKLPRGGARLTATVTHLWMLTVASSCPAGRPACAPADVFTQRCGPKIQTGYCCGDDGTIC
jgi:hypothetical protein